MRTPSILLLALSACGGTWSNRDLEFAAALPSRAELASTLPSNSSTSQPLRSGLNVGEPSQLYVDTKKASTDFNTLLDTFLGVLDAVRSVPPSTRADTVRVWGPYPAKDNPGYQFQVVIALVSEGPDTYAWGMQMRKIGDTTWIDVVRGAFQASAESVRKGMGQFEMPVKDFRDVLKVDDGLRQLDLIQIGYVKTDFPHITSMAFQYAPGGTSGLSAAGYASKRAADGSGAMGFSLISTDANVRRLDIISKWLADGAGFAIANVTEGNYRGSNRVECWDAMFRLVYFKESWPGGTEGGRPADCVAVDGL